KEKDKVIGCVGLRKLDDKTCEMKRLFVNDNYKGRGIGKKLVKKIIEEAKMKSYEKMRLDYSVSFPDNYLAISPLCRLLYNLCC
ncbi:MAG: GNAT family N-acetyltransferase, partial [Prevotellaceae bacterium]|nr:GNAT family N-acetyltransferase [Prevotellaceae bacterium]